MTEGFREREETRGENLRRLGLYLVYSVLVWFAPSCSAQTITVRVINGKDGHPLSKQGVTMSLLYDGTEKAPPGYSTQLGIETDDSGERTHRFFPLAMPL